MAHGRAKTADALMRVVVTRRAFTLLELIITLSVVTILIGLLTPALGAARETAQRLSCASNQHSIGSGLALYAKDNHDRLPPSYFGDPMVAKPQEMMAATIGPTEPVADRFEGLGWLATRAGGYVDCDKCFFCPSHRGEHLHESYGEGFKPNKGQRNFMNYHYRGDIDMATRRRRRIDETWSTIFLTDGLRTKLDFNHVRGGNRLHGDLSISWWDDRQEFVAGSLPDGSLPPQLQMPLYLQIWANVAEQ